MYEDNFALLKSSGFVFDQDTLQKEEERLLAEKEEEIAKKKYRESIRGRLGEAQKNEEEARKADMDADETVSQAILARFKAQTALTAAQEELQGAELKAKETWWGKWCASTSEAKGLLMELPRCRRCTLPNFYETNMVLRC